MEKIWIINNGREGNGETSTEYIILPEDINLEEKIKDYHERINTVYYSTIRRRENICQYPSFYEWLRNYCNGRVPEPHEIKVLDKM